MKFRKKPVVIDAVRIEKGMEIPEWLKDAIECGEVALYGTKRNLRDQPHAQVVTLEGTMRGDAGDWIIRGVAGEFYPCRNDIFEATYDAVEDDDAV